MSLTDPVEIEYLPKRNSYILVRGPETFYDADDCMIEFDTVGEALHFAETTLGLERAPAFRPTTSGQFRLPEGAGTRSE